MSDTAIKQRRLGGSGARVSALGLGTMSMSEVYGAPDDKESQATLDMALERGINFFDTADFYGLGHSEEVLREFLKRHKREQIFLSVKIGPMRIPGGGFGRPNGDPDYIKSQLAYDLCRLGVDTIDLYFPSRIDKRVPLEDQIGALVEMKEQGFIRHLGLSEVSATTVRKAHALHPIAAVQSEYSLWSRDPEPELLPTLRELGIAFVGYAPLGRGLLSGRIQSPESFEPRDIRRFQPRYQAGNFAKNAAIVERMAELARRKGVTAAQLAIAWVMAQGDDIIALVGTKNRARLAENLGAAEVTFTPEELRGIAALFPPGIAAGTRYPAHAMHTLDG